MIPRAGDVLLINRAVSVQFIEPFYFRVIRVLSYETYDHWRWLHGYVLNDRGEAGDKRDIFVQPARLRVVQPPQPLKRAARAGGNRR